MDNPYEFKMTTEVGQFANLIEGLEARQAAAMLVRAWLNGDCDGPFVGEALESDVFRQIDPAIDLVRDFFWVDEDFSLKPSQLSRPGWNYLQRLLLLLDSDCPFLEEKSVRRSWTQTVAVLSLIGFLIVVAKFGWGMHLMAFAMPFGLVSFVLWAIRRKLIPEPSLVDPIVEPFKSIADLEHAYLNCKSFRKQKYPTWIAELNKHSKSHNWDDIMMVPTFLIFLVAGPLFLLFQMFPVTYTRARAVAR